MNLSLQSIIKRFYAVNQTLDCANGLPSDISTSINTHKSSGFSLIELLVVIVCVSLLMASVGCITYRARENAKRIQCLANLHNIWRTASAWGLDPQDSFHPDFPNGHLVGQFSGHKEGVLSDPSIIAEYRLTPDMFICPSMADRVKPANCLTNVTETNSCYVYFVGRSGHQKNANKKALLCDMNGFNTLPGPATNLWGGNHQGEGGNIIFITGAGKWVDIASITNTEIINALTPEPTRSQDMPMVLKY